MITVSANSKNSNLSHSAKIGNYPDIIKQSPKLQIMAEKSSNWNKETIKDHNKAMLRKLYEEELTHFPCIVLQSHIRSVIFSFRNF